MRQILLLLLLPAILPAQTISFGLSTDSTGIYFIHQNVVSVNDSTETRAVAIRFDNPDAALNAVRGWRETITRDSATLQLLFRENTRQRVELDRAAARLKEIAYPENNKPKETPEQELARLRQENEALKRKN